MKRAAILLFLISMVVGGLLIYSTRHARNDLYEYCTTRAFGWPFPWRIDHCECDGQGGLTEFPPSTLAKNSCAVILFATVTTSILLAAWFPFRRPSGGG
jgi:hypothetical protein